MSIKRANASSVTKSGAGISDVPDAPTGLSATDSGDGTTASVSFTPAVTGGTATSYTVTSSPGSFTGTGASSPISVTGLSSGVAYTFTATATNSSGTSSASSASSSLTLASVGSYFLIQRTTLGSNQTTITFSSIPQTYTHLQLRILMRGSSGSQNAGFVRFNSDSANNYVNHQLFGNGSTTTSNGGSSVSGCYIQKVPGSSDAANCFGVAVMDILDYKNTSKYTTTRYLGGDDLNGSGFVFLGSGLWLNTAAITRVDIVTDGGGDFVAYSTFALYGILGA